MSGRHGAAVGDALPLYTTIILSTDMHSSAYSASSASFEALDAMRTARFFARDSDRRSRASFNRDSRSLWYSAASALLCKTYEPSQFPATSGEKGVAFGSPVTVVLLWAC